VGPIYNNNTYTSRRVARAQSITLNTMSLDDIWAEPIVEASASTAGPTNPNAEVNHRSEATKPRSALFLSDTEDEDTGSASRLPGQTPRTASPPTTGDTGALLSGPERAQLDEMFAGLDDDDDNDPFKDVAPAVDIESLKRQADARVAATSKSTLPGTSSPSLGAATRDKDNGDKGKKTKRVIPKLDAERCFPFPTCIHI
jgi:replication fork protection complex subunit TIPIN/Csm3/Swi3